MATTREQAMEALYALLQQTPGVVTFGRRLKLWNAVPAEMQPALYLVEHSEARLANLRGTPGRLQLIANIFLYVKTTDAEVIGGIELNNLLDAIEATIAPADPKVNVQTLGGLVNRCWINGTIIKDPGDIDGQGLAIIPINILFP
jgi:hypothetical protein